MILADFFRYCYIWSRLKEWEKDRKWEDPVSEIFRLLVEAPFRPPQARYFENRNIFRCELDTLRHEVIASSKASGRPLSEGELNKILEGFYALNAGDSRKGVWSNTNKFRKSDTLSEWKERGVALPHRIARDAGLDPKRRYQYEGIVITSRHSTEERRSATVWIALAKDESVLEKDRAALAAWFEQQLRQPDEEQEPPHNRWFGADPTVLIDADYRMKRANELLVPPTSPGYEWQGAEADKKYQSLVTILTNHTGIHCLSLYGFPKKQTPIMRLWKELATHWQARGLAPDANSIEDLAPKDRISKSIRTFPNAYKDNDGEALARWAAFQLHNRSIIDMFWGSNNKPDDIYSAWIAYKGLELDKSLEAIFQARALDLSENPFARDTGLTPSQFGIGYSVWSYAKGFAFAARHASYVHYEVAWQRQPCIKLGLKEVRSIGEEEIRHLFPWGIIMHTISTDIRDENDDVWLYNALKVLRSYTIELLPGLMMDLQTANREVTTEDAKRAWPQTSFALVASFVYKGLEQITGWERRIVDPDDYVDIVNVLSVMLATGEDWEREWLKASTRRYAATIPSSVRSNEAQGKHFFNILNYQSRVVEAVRNNENRLKEFLADHGLHKIERLRRPKKRTATGSR